MLPLLLKFAGFILICLSVLHAFFGKRFNWNEELARLSLLNRQIFLVHCFFIALTVALMGVLALLYTEELLEPSPLGKVITAGLCLFWGVRLIFQWFVYDSALWKGHRFNTAMHVAFSVLWIFLTGVFGVTFASQIAQ